MNQFFFGLIWRRVATMLVACLAILFAPASACAADYFWTGSGATGGNGTWSNVNNWSTVVSATTPRPSAGPTAADNVYFGTTNATALATVALTADAAAQSLTQFATMAGNLTISGNGGATDRTLTIGSGGISQLANQGITLGSGSATNRVNMRLDGSQTWSGTATTGGASMTFRNGISRVAGDTTNRTLAFDFGTTYQQPINLNGVVADGGASGSLSIWNAGLGTLVLAGTNTYTGRTTISSGYLSLVANALPTSGTLALRGTGDPGRNGIMLGTGSFATPTIVVETGMNIMTAGRTTTADVSGTANLGTITRTGGVVSFQRIGTGSTAFLVGNANNAAGILGAWAIGANNQYVTVSSGSLAVVTTSTVTEAGLTSATGVDAVGTPLTLTASRSAYAITGSGGAGATINLGNNNLTVSGLNASSGSWIIQRTAGATGTLIIGSDRELILAGGVDYSISVPIVDNAGGASRLTWAGNSGGAELILSGSNSYSGGTEFSSSNQTGVAGVTLNHAYALGTGTLTINPVGNSRSGLILRNTSGSAITLATNNAQVWNGNFQYTGTSDLNMGTGIVSLGATPLSTRSVNVTANKLTIGGGIVNGSHSDLPTTGLTKAGVGVLELSGSNSYTGPTTVSAGSLLVNGLLQTSAVTVQSGALLGGSGVLGSVSVLAGGTFSPGNSPGLLSTGPLSLAGTTLMEISGVSPRGGVGGYDATDVTGALTYGGSMLIDFAAGITGAMPDNTTFNLFDFTSSSGTFTGITTANNGSFYAGLTFTDAGSGDKWTATKDSQTLEFTHSTGNLEIVPEPASIALAGIGIAAAAWAFRRRRR